MNGTKLNAYAQKNNSLEVLYRFDVQLEAIFANVISSICSFGSFRMRFYEPVNQIKRNNSHLLYPIMNPFKRLPITNGNSFRYHCGKWL